MVDVRAIGAGGGSIAQRRGGRLPARRAARARAPCPGPPATAAAASCRPSPTPTSCSGSSTRSTSSAGGSGSTPTAARRAIDAHVARAARPRGRGGGRRHQARRRRANGRPAANRDDRAGPRPAGLRAATPSAAPAPTHAPAFALELVDERARARKPVGALGARRGRLRHRAHARARGADAALPDGRRRPTSSPNGWSRSSAGSRRRAHERLAAQGVPEDATELVAAGRSAVHAPDEDASGPVPAARSTRLLEDFLRAYAQALRRRGAIPETSRVRARDLRRRRRQGRLPRPQLARLRAGRRGRAAAARGNAPRLRRRARSRSSRRRSTTGPELRPGNRLAGPAIVEYPGTTVALLSGQDARASTSCSGSRSRDDGRAPTTSSGPSPADWDELLARARGRPGHVRDRPPQARGDQRGAGDRAEGGLGLADRHRRERLQQRALHRRRPDRLDGPAGRLPQRARCRSSSGTSRSCSRDEHRRRRHVRRQRPVLRRRPPPRRLARRADLPRRPAPRLGRRRRAPGRHGRHEHRLDLGPRAGEAAGGPDDAADEADRPRAAPRRTSGG